MKPSEQQDSVVPLEAEAFTIIEASLGAEEQELEGTAGDEGAITVTEGIIEEEVMVVAAATTQVSLSR